MKSIHRAAIGFAGAIVALMLLIWLIAGRVSPTPGQVLISPREDVAADSTLSATQPGLSPLDQRGAAIAILEREEPLGEEARSKAWLRTSGQRYALISQPTASGIADIVVDLVEGRSTSILPAGSHTFETNSGTIVYVEPQRVSIYRKDWPEVQTLPGSQLGPDKSYASEEGASFTPIESHTDNAVTLSIFWDLAAEPFGEQVTDPATGKPRQLGTITLPLP